jgi:predicted protein tyrosine phosphatase
MKRILILLSSFCFALPTIAKPLASAPCDATYNNPCLVEEINTIDYPLQCLRFSPDIRKYYQGNRNGLEDLPTSASAIPTESGWSHLYQSIRTVHPHGPIYVLDLREESHGYINGLPYTLMERYNWINLDKTDAETAQSEKNWLEQLATRHDLHFVLTAQLFDQHLYDQGQSREIRQVNSEEDFVSTAGMIYKRLNISDHRAPRSEVVNQFLQFYQNLPDDGWIHFHCRGGKGRSTTFLAMVDMLKNADQVSFDKIIARQAAIAPFYNLSHTVRYDPELTPYYQARYHFLRVFHRYAQSRLAGYQGNWTDWLSSTGESTGLW